MIGSADRRPPAARLALVVADRARHVRRPVGACPPHRPAPGHPPRSRDRGDADIDVCRNRSGTAPTYGRAR